MSRSVVGESIVTEAGILALAKAAANGKGVKPATFRFRSSGVTELDPQMTAGEFGDGWIERDISLYRVLNGDTVEFTCDVPPEDAASYARLAGIFLDDGTLFMVAKPPFPFPPSLRQTFKIQMIYRRADELMDFSYLPHVEAEQDLRLLNALAVLGDQLHKIRKGE